MTISRGQRVRFIGAIILSMLACFSVLFAASYYLLGGVFDHVVATYSLANPWAILACVVLLGLFVKGFSWMMLTVPYTVARYMAEREGFVEAE